MATTLVFCTRTYSAIDRAQVALVSHRNHLQAGGGKSRTAGDPPPNLQLIMIILYILITFVWADIPTVGPIDAAMY
jgi:hypothetical protein